MHVIDQLQLKQLDSYINIHSQENRKKKKKMVISHVSFD